MHGWGCDQKNVQNIAKELSVEFRILLVDFYGFGKSRHPDRALYLKDFADSILDIIDAYKIKKLTLIGHSFGARVSIFLSAHYPEIVDKLILLNPAGIKPRRSIKYYFKIYHFKFKKYFGLSVANFGSLDYINSSSYLRLSFKNIIKEHLNPLLPLIQAPTLVIAGSNDKDIKPHMICKLSKMIKHNKTIILKNCGHFCHLEKPGETISIIKEFMGDSIDNN
jgi:pimeloyl-ACP methyl ester carboxylesterase